MSSAQQLLLTAIRSEVEHFTHLAMASAIVGDISRFIHRLQRERGASTIYLASRGQRFAERRTRYLADSREAEAIMRERLEALSAEARPQASPRLLHRIAALWFALDELPALRTAVEGFAIKPDAATQAFNQLISGLLAVVFDAADSSADPEITRTLVAIFHLMQGKELAGQERACGAYGFTQGHFDAAHRALLKRLIVDQQRCLDTFLEFAPSETQDEWHNALPAACYRDIEALRALAGRTDPAAPLSGERQNETRDVWYALTTQRIDALKTLEDGLTAQLTALCHRKIERAQASLEHARKTPRRTPNAPCEQLLGISDTQTPLGELTESMLTSNLGRSLVELTQAQASRLQNLSDELENTRKALRERKLVERAKGVIMAHQQMSEEQAYRFLRKTSMDQSRSMADMAQSILDLSTMLTPKGSGLT